MVVVLGQVLRQLEASEVVARRDPPSHPGVLQLDQVPVCRAAWQLRECIGDVGDAHRVAATGQVLDEGSSSCGVALADASEPGLDERVKFFG